MDNILTSAELRVLGALIEKETTTPEYYPLSLNSLTTACNQKSNRWPVTEYSDDEVVAALDSLRARGFAAAIVGGGRVTKYAQRFTEKLNLGRRETAVLCVLMLRGPQTVGEIRGRTERLYAFADLEETETVLNKLTAGAAGVDGAFVQKLPQAPGTKESRYAQTLGGPIDAAPAPASAAAVGTSDRLSTLEAEVSRLRDEITELRRRLDALL